MYFSVFIGLLPTVTMKEDVIHIQCIVSQYAVHNSVINASYINIQVHVWFYGVGYFLVYGTVLAKMWRVYQIFHKPNHSKTVCINPGFMLLVLTLCYRF